MNNALNAQAVTPVKTAPKATEPVEKNQAAAAMGAATITRRRARGQSGFNMAPDCAPVQALTSPVSRASRFSVARPSV